MLLAFGAHERRGRRFLASALLSIWARSSLFALRLGDCFARNLYHALGIGVPGRYRFESVEKDFPLPIDVVSGA
jgi:hypothetical protein